MRKALGMAALRQLACWAACWGLCACTIGASGVSGSLNVWPQPLPNHDAVWLHVTQRDTGVQSLVAAQSGGGQWRWVQTDAFGAPLARQIADARGWRNDGFLPPNAAATHLFAALAVQVAAQAHVPPETLYPDVQRGTDGDWQVFRFHGREAWRMRAVPGGEEIRLADGSVWQSAVIQGEAP